jgi:hypothetical protein
MESSTSGKVKKSPYIEVIHAAISMYVMLSSTLAETQKHQPAIIDSTVRFASKQAMQIL